MKRAPDDDPAIGEYLDQRGFPANQDCEGTPEALRVVGRRLPREDAWQKVTGQARYAADLKLPRCLFGLLLRSPHPHARILGVDISATAALEGVAAVISGADFHGRHGIIPWTRDERPLCTDRVRYVGDEVAAVAAVDLETARRALALIRVDYEELPASFTAGPLAAGGTPLHDKHPDNLCKEVALDFGDAPAALSRAQAVVADSYHYEASTHAALEPHAALAQMDAAGLLTVWSSTQTPHYLQRDLARLLELPAAQVRVVKPHLGGGFGGKSEPFALEFAAALLARRSGRPVKIVYEREECFLSHRGRHATTMKAALGWHPDAGLCLDYEAVLDGGAYSSYGMITTYYSGALNAGLYRFSDYRWRSRRWFTSKPPAGPKRGHGAVQPRLALECLLDRLAEKLGRDPIAFRRELCLGADARTLNQLEVGSSGFLQCLERAEAASGWREKFRRLPFGRGVGVAASFYISGTNYPILADLLPQSGAQLKADRSGLVTLFSGAADIGQGSDGVLRQIVAEELGIDERWCRVVSADSDLCPVDLGSYSSRVTLMAGNAALSAARRLRKEILGAVAARWGLPVARLALMDDEVRDLEDESRRLGWLAALECAETRLGTLGATGSYTTPNRGGRYRGALVGASPAYSFTVTVAQVSVDLETGRVRVEEVWCAHDCGRAINPAQVEGQIEGSVHMGVGEALMERFLTRRGVVTTPSLLDYPIPTSVDSPRVHALLVEAPDPQGPYGAKEAGEGPLLPTTPAVANAIYDAVGLRLTRAPFLPQDVLRGLRAAGEQA